MNLEEIKVRLTELANKEHRLVEEINAVEAEFNSLSLERFYLEKGVRLGDTVIGSGYSLEAREFRVVHIDPKYGWITGNPKKSDGTFGIQKKNLYSNWKKKP